MRRRQRRQRREENKEETRENMLAAWKPKTELGKNVKTGKIASLDDIWAKGKVIKEPEILEYFLAGLEERVLPIGRAGRPFKWVQRMTDSGRRNRYCVIAAIGNKDGYVGIGRGIGKEYGTAIKQGIRRAKLNITKVERGCGSWDCGCDGNHSIRREVLGKVGSISITLKPAPKGTGIAANSISKDVLELAGIKDIWSNTRGHTSTRENLARATYTALRNLGRMRGVKKKIVLKEQPKTKEGKPPVKKEEKAKDLGKRAKELNEKAKVDEKSASEKLKEKTKESKK